MSGTGADPRPPGPARGTDDERVEAALPGYEVDGELGRGAMGEVLSGRHVRLERPVAIKRLPLVFADDAEVRERFAAEAKVLASFNHPHVVPVYDYVEERGLCLLVMQALTGGTVWDRFSREGLSMPAACAVVVTACAGLHHAHQRHVLHRDVKPENLMFDDEQVLKVTDFGIATAIGGGETLATLDGRVIGTPEYMAPEQAEGAAVGPPADVYAAGTMLYELLSGRLPFDDEDAMALLRRRVTEDPTPLDQVAPAVPGPLVEVVMAAIARRPEDRPATAEALGVAVATAAAEAWGPDWLAGTELPLLSSDAIARTATAPTAPGAPPAAAPGAPTVRPGTVGPAPETRSRHDRADPAQPPAPAPAPATVRPEAPDGSEPAPGTVRPGAPGPLGPAPATVAPDGPGVPAAPATPAAPAARVRPTVVRRAGVDIGDVDQRDLVPLSDALRPPGRPVRALLVLGALVVALVAVALSGWGGTTGGEALAPGQVTVAGRDLATTDRVAIDLTEPVEVSVDGDVAGAELVSIDTSVAGLPAGSSSIQELRAGDGRLTASVDASALRRLTSGDVGADLQLADELGDPVLTHRFTLDQRDPQLLNGTVVLALVVTLVVGVYVASTTRPLRLGRRRPSAYPGLAVLGAVGGVGVGLWTWALVGPAPTAVTLVVTALLGAAAAPLGGWCLFVAGRRRRLRRAAAAPSPTSA